MNSIKLRMTAQTPSAFGMPISGHASVVSTCARLVDVQGTTASAASIERHRLAGFTGTNDAVKADMGPAYVLGTTAWRPPTC